MVFQNSGVSQKQLIRQEDGIKKKTATQNLHICRTIPAERCINGLMKKKKTVPTLECDYFNKSKAFCPIQNKILHVSDTYQS